MTTACHKKCVVPRYKDSELSKGIGTFRFYAIEDLNISRWIGLYWSMCGEIYGGKKRIFDYFSMNFLFRFMIELENN